MGFLTAFSRVVLDMTVAVRMRIMTMMIITMISVIIITIIIQVVTLVILTLPGFPPYTTFSPVKFPSPPPWTGDHNDHQIDDHDRNDHYNDQILAFNPEPLPPM